MSYRHNQCIKDYTACATDRATSEQLERRIALSVFTVQNTLNAGAGCLRQAILDANALTGADAIVFSSLFNAAQTIATITPLPQIGSDLTITGPGSSLLTVRLNAAITPVSGIFNSTTANLTITGMTLTGANVNGNGGGLQAIASGSGPLVTLDDMRFTGNTVSGLGGAIYLGNNAKLIIRDSTIASNTASSGAGICFFSNGALVMENCTIRGNTTTSSSSGGGAGLDFFGAAAASPPAGFVANTLLIRNSTFDHNTSARAGGAILVETFTGNLQIQNTTLSDNTAATSGGAIGAASGPGTITLQNSTVAGNAANVSGTSAGFVGGGGVWRNSIVANSVTLTNTIVSGNTSAVGPDIRTDAFSSVQANYCAIGSANGFSLVAGSGNNIVFGTDLKLGTLLPNGGPQQTRALLAGSPLLNAGSNALTPAALTTDGRGAGFARIAGTAIDIGAFERATTGPVVLSKQFLFETAPQRVAIQFSEDVFDSILGGQPFELRNMTTSTDYTSDVGIAYSQNTMSLSPTIAPFTLPDGNYRLTVFAGEVTNAAGAHLQASEVFEFFVLAGDANRDRRVNFDDLLILAQNYLRASFPVFSQGDFNYDDVVNFDDLLILAQRYNTSLAAVESRVVPGVPTVRRRRAAPELFEQV